MAQANTDTQPISEQDPLRDVKLEIQQGAPHLNHVEKDEELPEDTQKKDVVTSDLPSDLIDELKEKDTFGSSRDDGIVTSNAAGAADEVTQGNPSAATERQEKSGEGTLRTKDLSGVIAGKKDLADPSSINFRVSANPRPGGPLSRDLKPDEVNVGEGKDNTVSNDAASVKETDSVSNAEVSVATSQFLPRVPIRGTPTFRVSAHHGMRPGGPLSRDLASETSESGDTGGVATLDGSGLRGQTAPARGGFSNSGPRRGGGLARANSGVPVDKKGGASLARSGSGVPGFSSAHTRSTDSGGTFNSLARTGSGVPSLKDTNALKDFTSMLDSKN